MMMSTLWTCFATCFLGLWLMVAPVSFNYFGSPLGWSDGISGLLLVLLGWRARSQKSLWLPWVIAFVGVWLEAAPLIFWAKSAAIYLNDTIVGALVILFSIILPHLPGQLSDEGPSLPPGWSYNPSSWPQRFPIFLLAMVGWFISRYLAAYQLGYINQVWDPLFGDGTLRVITSNVSHAFPVSDAGLGAMAYTMEALLACKGGARRWCTMPWMVVLFGILVVPLGLTSIVLIILQPLVVGSWCTLCLVTAFCMLVMIALAIDEVVAVTQLLRSSKKRIFWKGTIPRGIGVDNRTPTMDAPLSKLLPAMVWGISIPWNLFVCALLGIWVMLCPSLLQESVLADSDHLLGALVVVVSVISMAEVAREMRLLNLVLGACLLLPLMWRTPALPSLLNHIAVGGLLILFSLRRGQIDETYRKS